MSMVKIFVYFVLAFALFGLALIFGGMLAFAEKDLDSTEQDEEKENKL